MVLLIARERLLAGACCCDWDVTLFFLPWGLKLSETVLVTIRSRTHSQTALCCLIRLHPCISLISAEQRGGCSSKGVSKFLQKGRGAACIWRCSETSASWFR